MANQFLTFLSTAVLATTVLASSASAETEMEQALAHGAKRMTSADIAERLADKTVTFDNVKTGTKALVYYDGLNGTLIKREGSNETIEGFYAVTLSDHICLGVHGDEPMQLRCVNVVLIDGLMHKFEMDGSLRGRVIEETDGNVT